MHGKRNYDNTTSSPCLYGWMSSSLNLVHARGASMSCEQALRWEANALLEGLRAAHFLAEERHPHDVEVLRAAKNLSSDA